MSDGWKEKPPKENQLCAPLAVCPKKNKTSNRLEKIIKSATKISVLFKNLKSIKEREKSATKEIPIHINWRLKKEVSLVKDSIVTSPAKRTGTINNMSNQSMLLETLFVPI